MLDSIETSMGTAAKVQIWAGSMPATCATAIGAQTKLVEITLASDWAANASAGSKAFSNTPINGTASGTGTAAFFRIVDNAGTTCHMQGSIATSGADLNLDNTSINTGQTVSITSWQLTAPGA